MNMQTMLAEHAQKVLAHQSGDYISKDTDEQAELEELMDTHGLKRIYRFDIGKNTDGIPPLLQGFLALPGLAATISQNIADYPDNHFRHLRRQIAMRHGIPDRWMAFGAGLESVIDQICRAVLEPGDRVLIPTPNFSVFEDMSRRAGADVATVAAPPPVYRWTEAFTKGVVNNIHRKQPKLIWLSNPVNPTGEHLPPATIARLCAAAEASGSLMAVDEAYGEYTDTDESVISASTLLKEHPHLLVLRTFSKMYALPSARVGYMMCSSQELIRAVNAFRPTFPLPWTSLRMAQVAIADDPYVCRCRALVRRRRTHLLSALRNIPGITVLESDTNTLMMRHETLPGGTLHGQLAKKGFITANLDRVTGIESKGFLRLTVRTDRENRHLLNAVATVANRPASDYS